MINSEPTAVDTIVLLYPTYLFLALSIWKFEAFTAVVILIRGGVPSVESLLQFAQLNCYTQHSFISAASFWKFDALPGVVTLIRGGEPTVQNLPQFAHLYHCI